MTIMTEGSGVAIDFSSLPKQKHRHVSVSIVSSEAERCFGIAVDITHSYTSTEKQLDYTDMPGYRCSLQRVPNVLPRCPYICVPLKQAPNDVDVSRIAGNLECIAILAA
jgi:hypothetical protein